MQSFPKDSNWGLPPSLQLCGQYLRYLFSLEEPSEGAGSQGNSETARWKEVGGQALHSAGPLWLSPGDCSSAQQPRKEPLQLPVAVGNRNPKAREKERERRRKAEEAKNVT